MEDRGGERRPLPTTLAPWLNVRNGASAVEFYKVAFAAIETYRLDSPDGGVVARLAVDRAEFWVSNESSGPDNVGPVSLGVDL